MSDTSPDRAHPSAPPSRDANSHAQLARCVEPWRAAGAMLDRVRLEELKQLTDAEAARLSCDLLWPLAPRGGGDDAAGMVPIKDAMRRLALAA